MIWLFIITLVLNILFTLYWTTATMIYAEDKENEPKEVKVRYRDDFSQRHLKKIPEGDCIDLYNFTSTKYKAGDTVVIDLGVAMKLPEGYEAHIYPRSSTFQRTGLLLTNSVGIIDNSYQGNNDYWGAKFYATRDGEIKAGERLLQFRIMKNQPELKFTAVNNLYAEDRGGYGTTNE